MSLGKGEKWGKTKRVREKEKRAYSSQASWSRSSSTADPWREGTTSTAEERGRSNQQRNGQNSSYNGRRKESYKWKTRKVSTTEGYFPVAPGLCFKTRSEEHGFKYSLTCTLPQQLGKNPQQGWGGLWNRVCARDVQGTWQATWPITHLSKRAMHNSILC